MWNTKFFVWFESLKSDEEYNPYYVNNSSLNPNPLFQFAEVKTFTITFWTFTQISNFILWTGSVMTKWLHNDWFEINVPHKWPLYDHFCPFFCHMFIFHKTEVQTVILRCLTNLHLDWFKSYGLRCRWKPHTCLANSINSNW